MVNQLRKSQSNRSSAVSPENVIVRQEADQDQFRLSDDHNILTMAGNPKKMKKF